MTRGIITLMAITILCILVGAHGAEKTVEQLQDEFLDLKFGMC